MSSAIQESKKLAVYANMLRSPSKSPKPDGISVQEVVNQLHSEFGED